MHSVTSPPKTFDLLFWNARLLQHVFACLSNAAPDFYAALLKDIGVFRVAARGDGVGALGKDIAVRINQGGSR